MLSKAFCKSIRITQIIRAESNPVNIVSVKYKRQVSVEWFLRNPDGNRRMLFYVKRFKRDKVSRNGPSKIF